jgi:3-deoxy-7-phosphoheptulonate synthase
MSLPTPGQLLEDIPLHPHHREFISEVRTSIESVLGQGDDRILLIVGPCSIHDVESTIDYAQRLRNVIPRISKVFLPLMRVYFEKPRSVIGWKGFVSDPYLDGSNDIAMGLRSTRQLLVQLADMQIPTAAEFLEPTSATYFGDLISWGCIGARTIESQIHRQMASMLPMPVGFKNSTSGDIEVAINSIIASSLPHTYIGYGCDGRASIQQSHGNAYPHLVLRGGAAGPNYDAHAISKALAALNRANLPGRVVVDCAHGNSFRSHANQPAVFRSLIDQIANGFRAGHRSIKGILLESHINSGNQEFPKDMHALKYGVSITDPCLGWDSTEALLQWGYCRLSECLDHPFSQSSARRELPDESIFVESIALAMVEEQSGSDGAS